MSLMKKKIFLKLELELLSPICISNGINLNTDIDVIRDYYGVPFIPGSSIAGVIRNYLRHTKVVQKNLFGYSEMENEKTISKISNLFVYDSFFNKKVKVDIRDGVRLDENKIAIEGNKFDWEIISPGNQFFLKLELNISETMEEEELISSLKSIVLGIEEGVIRFGFKKNRGFGKCRVCSVYCKEYTKAQIVKCRNIDQMEWLNSWMQFSWDDMGDDVKEIWIKGVLQEEYDKVLSIPLKLKGGISIRRYASDMEKPDFEHITNLSKGEDIPIIPGTSWAGAIRHRCHSILEEMKVENQIIDEMLDCMFGFVKNNKAVSSLIVVDESNLDGSNSLIIRRTKIDSFTSAAFPSGLFDELSYFQGKTELKINIKNIAGCEQRCGCNHLCDGMWIIGLLLLVKDDIENGYLPIGGQTAIGRGIFEKYSDSGEENKEEQKKYLKALNQYIIQKEEIRRRVIHG